MKQQELYDKFLKFSNVFENNYNNSEYDITDTEFFERKSWLLNMAYMIGLTNEEFTDKEIDELDSRLEEFKKELVAIQNI